MHIGKKNKVLLATLALSLCGHAGVIYFWWPSTTHTSWVRPGQIQVNVIASRSKESGTKRILDKNDDITRPTTKSMDVARNKLRDILKPDSFSQNMGSESSGTKAALANPANALTVQLRGRIRTALQKHLAYPPLARRRGWQGTVTIRVTIRENGDLQQIKLTKSSGYSLLDKSAIMALQKVEHLNELKPLLQGRTIPIELPITYLLTEPVNGRSRTSLCSATPGHPCSNGRSRTSLCSATPGHPCSNGSPSV